MMTTMISPWTVWVCTVGGVADRTIYARGAAVGVCFDFRKRPVRSYSSSESDRGLGMKFPGGLEKFRRSVRINKCVAQLSCAKKHSLAKMCI
jgi:hypothetical protein